VGLALRPSTPAPREQRQPKREQRAEAADSEAHGIPAGPVFRFRSGLRRAVWLAPWRARPSKPWGCGSRHGGAHDAAPYDAPVPALVILKLLKPDDPRNGELLTALTDALGWTVPLEARFGRIEIGFVGDTMEEGMSRVGAALDQAGAELGVDWTDYLKFAGGMG
jgi:hypothetical protein